ncbi:MAG: heparin lyase I family protein [Pseudomonadota bacterium]
MALLAMVLAFSTPAAAQRTQAEGLTNVDIQRVNGRDRYQRVRFSDGSPGEQFRLKSGDCPRSNEDCQSDRERIEFFEKNPAQPVGSDVWLASSVMMAPETPARRATNLVLGQFHQRADSGPALMFQALDGRYGLKMTDHYRLDDDPMNPIPDFRNVDFIRLGDMRGRWTPVMVNARWSRGDHGLIRVWINGRQAWSYDGPTVNANEPVYFKYGIYRSSVSRCGGPCPELVAYYRDVKRGRSRAEVE